MTNGLVIFYPGYSFHHCVFGVRVLSVTWSVVLEETMIYAGTALLVIFLFVVGYKVVDLIVELETKYPRKRNRL